MLRRQVADAQLDRRLAVHERLQRGLADDLPVLDERHAVAGDFDFRKQVRVEKHRRALALEVADNVAHQSAAHRVEARGRFVEEDQLGFVEERLRQPDALEHPFGKRAQL